VQDLTQDDIATMVMSAKAFNARTTSIQSYTLVALCPGVAPGTTITMADTIIANLDGGYRMYMCQADSK
jgi:hypothetical protein